MRLKFVVELDRDERSLVEQVCQVVGSAVDGSYPDNLRALLRLLGDAVDTDALLEAGRVAKRVAAGLVPRCDPSWWAVAPGVLPDTAMTLAARHRQYLEAVNSLLGAAGDALRSAGVRA